MKRDVGRATSFDRKETGRQGCGEKGQTSRGTSESICWVASSSTVLNPECAAASPGGLLKVDRCTHP